MRKLFVGLLLLVSVVAYGDIRLTLVLNPDSTIDTEFSDGSKPPSSASLSWDLSTLPSLVGLETSTAFNHDVRACCLSGTDSATATITIVDVSGDVSADNGWSIVMSDQLDNPGTDPDLPGSGSFRLRATQAGDSADSVSRNWSYVTSGTDTTAPVVPFGLSSVEGPSNGQFTLSWDQTDDPMTDDNATPSGIAQYVISHPGGTTTVSTGLTDGTSLNWDSDCVEVEDFTPNPSASQTGTAITLSSVEGEGLDQLEDQIFFCKQQVSGDFKLTTKISSVTGATGSFTQSGLVEYNGVVNDAAFCSCHYQSTDDTVQQKCRASAGVNSANQGTTSPGVGLPIWIQHERSGDVRTCRYSTTGNDWVDVSSFTLSSGTTTDLGIFATSNSDQPGGSAAITSVFDWIALNDGPRLSQTITDSSGNCTVRADDADANMATSAAVTCTPQASAVPAKRWNPGNYMLLFKGDTNWVSRCNEIASEANVLGLLVRPDWDEIETSEDVFDWTATDAVVDACAANGKNVFFLVLDRAFGGVSDADRCPAPQYVKNLDGGTGCMATKNGGMAALHKEIVMDELIELHTAIANRYDDNPGFGGSMPEESTPGFGGVSPPADYTKAGHAAQLVRMYSEVSAVHVKSVFTAQLNFLSGQEATLVDGVNDGNAGFGGPDLYPAACTSGRITMQQLYLDNYVGAVPGLHQIQAPEMGGSIGNCSVSELHGEAQALSLSYIFWLRKTATPGITWAADILPAIQAGLAVTETCPTNFTGGCE